MASQINLQDNLLNHARVEKVPVTMFLMNGVQVKGQIKGYDQFSLIIETPTKQQQLIYKHAISTIIPAKTLSTEKIEKEDSAAAEK